MTGTHSSSCLRPLDICIFGGLYFSSSVFLYFCIIFSIDFSDSCIFVLFCIFFERVVTSVFCMLRTSGRPFPEVEVGRCLDVFREVTGNVIVYLLVKNVRDAD